MELKKLSDDLNRFESNEELNAVVKYMKNFKFKKIKTSEDIEEWNKQVDYMNSRQFIDDIMSGKIK